FQCERKLLFAPQHIAAEIVVNTPRFGEFDRPLAAIQQSRAQAPFHLLNVLRRGRLADSALLRPLAQAASCSYLPEKTLLPEDHIRIITKASIIWKVKYFSFVKY